MLAVVAAAAAVVTLLVIKTREDNARFALKNTEWVSVSAVNASGDEADLYEVYNVKYDNYQGRLNFDGNNRFELWLTPGDPDDGTHSGTYELKGDTVYAKFDEGTKAEFDVKRENGKITGIDIGYEEYVISFARK